MRWDGLFADLEAQADALSRAERAAEVEERTRGEIARLGWQDRLRASVGESLRISLVGGFAVTGRVRRASPDWLLVEEAADRELLVVAAAVVGIRGLGRYAAAPDAAGLVESRLGLRYALRGLARDRSVVRAHRIDGTTLDATVDRVGGDFVELAAHSAGEVRRRQDVRDVELVPLDALAAVQRVS